MADKMVAGAFGHATNYGSMRVGPLNKEKNYNNKREIQFTSESYEKVTMQHTANFGNNPGSKRDAIILQTFLFKP